MEKIEKYQRIVLKIFKKYEALTDNETHLITDILHHHYQIVNVGWGKSNEYFYWATLHLHIKPDGKVWILENRTEDDIAEILASNGIPKSDIVIGLIPTYMRPYSGYAVA